MSNETDLDWLARTEHHWPEDAVYVSRHENAVEWHYVELAFKGLGHFTKDQWLARRAELQNKPRWKDAPEWAEWLTQDSPDSDGCAVWWWFELSPEKGRDEWTTGSSTNRVETSNQRGEVLGDWRDTLEKRPEQDEFETFISIEDSQEKDMTQQQEMKQDSGWFERGELPPIGVECEWLECLQTGWQTVTIVGYYLNAAWIVPKGKEPISVFNPTGFRPIRTERDVLIEIIKKTDDTDDRIADAILAAGFSLGAK